MSSFSYWSQLKRNDLFGSFIRLFVLGAVLSLVFLAVFTFADNVKNRAECQSAFLIILICSGIGHLAGEFPKGDRFVLLRLTGPIWARTGLLLIFLVLKINGKIGGKFNGDLSNHSFIYYILTFYLTGLFVDITLASFRTWHVRDSQSTVDESVVDESFR